MTHRTPLRIAVIGAGPVGLHAAEQLICNGMREVHVDILEARPAAPGLIKFTQAIDGAVEPLPEHYTRPHLRVIGNVTVGRDVLREELDGHYDAVLDATTGAAPDAVDVATLIATALGDVTDLLAFRRLPHTVWTGWRRLDESVRRGAGGWRETVLRARAVPVCDQ